MKIGRTNKKNPLTPKTRMTIEEKSSCCGALIEKQVVGHRWNFRHPTEWEMAHYFCTLCEEELDLNQF